MKYLVTGGAGFIGCNFVRDLLQSGDSVEKVVVLDSLTYAGNLDNLADIISESDLRLEILPHGLLGLQLEGVAQRALDGVEVVVHLAAESHVDRSIQSAETAVRTNIEGTFRLLEACRRFPKIQRIIHISTDEVYGASACIDEIAFDESIQLRPRNPYAASKAAGEQLAYSYYVTYGLPVIIARPTNNYGPYQFPEKLIPLFVYKALRDEPLPVYGDGRQIRDWLHVGDHCRAIECLTEKGIVGQVYNIVGGNEHQNIEIVRLILDELGKPDSLIKHVADRPGHDIRYHLDGSKLAKLGWQPQVDWEQGMRETIRWFADHYDWLEASYQRGQDFFAKWYKDH